MSSKKSKLWSSASSDASAWVEAWEQYPQRLRRLNRSGLIGLDAFVQRQLPKNIAARSEPHITSQELMKLMKWKLTRGKFRPRLEKLAASNSEDFVVKCSQDAFAVVSPFELAMTKRMDEIYKFYSFPHTTALNGKRADFLLAGIVEADDSDEASSVSSASASTSLASPSIDALGSMPTAELIAAIVHPRGACSQALAKMCELRGVGPATASAILSAAAPHVFPFMADEVLYCCCRKPFRYSAAEYRVAQEQLLVKAVAVCRLLSIDQASGMRPSAHMVGQALWSDVAQHYPPRKPKMPPKEKAKRKRKHPTTSTKRKRQR